MMENVSFFHQRKCVIGLNSLRRKAMYWLAMMVNARLSSRDLMMILILHLLVSTMLNAMAKMMSYKIMRKNIMVIPLITQKNPKKQLRPTSTLSRNVWAES